MLTLANLKIKYKLLLLLLFPLIGLLYFSILTMRDKVQIVLDTANLATLTQLSIHLAQVVHTIQSERGSSSLFVKTQGQVFAAELRDYHQQTDKAVTAFKNFVHTLNFSSLATDIREKIDYLFLTITKLSAVRDAVLNLNIEQKQVVEQYVEINQVLLEFIVQTTHIKNYKEVFPLKLAYLNLLRAKEMAGLERALLAAVFSQKAIQADQLRQLSELIAKQDAYLTHDVMSYLTPAQKDFLTAKLSEPVIQEMNKLREVIYQAEVEHKEWQPVDPTIWFKLQTAKIELLKAVADQLAQDLYEKSNEANRKAYSDFIRLLSITILLTGVTLLFFFLVWLNLTKRLKQFITVARTIADGHFDAPLGAMSTDETGQLLGTFADMQVQLRQRLATETQAMQEARRINRALDYATTNILIADNHYRIIYLNEAAKRLFQQEELNIRKDIPHFKADQLLNVQLDVFHKNPLHQRQFLSQLTDSHQLRITIGDLILDHIITPVNDVAGNLLGYVVEFNNRTVELATEQEINQVIQAASQGDFQKRIRSQDKTGFFKTFSEGINQVLNYNQRAIEDIMHIVAALAAGDLTKKIANNYLGALDQLKKDINVTIDKLTTVMTAIMHTAETVKEATEEISQGNLSLSQRTEEQAASLEETAASMEQMTGSVQKNAENANQASELAMTAKSNAEKGGQVVGTTIVAMSEIHRSSQKIKDIINVINEIAFQTNLLALNAAVEAARAGDQGRGFAVVATEVRNLAQRSATAAKEIRSLIEDSVTKVEEGTRLANQSGETLAEIISAITLVSDLIAEIAAATREQSLGILQVNKSIAQMDEMTQQNAALVEEAATASGALKEQALSLKEQVAFFKVSKIDLPVEKKNLSPRLPLPVRNTLPVKQLASPVAKDNDWVDF